MSRPNQQESKYKELDSIMIRLEPISKCIDYQYAHIPEKLQWAGISKHKKMRDLAVKLYFYSDKMLRVFDKDYKPYDGEYADSILKDLGYCEKSDLVNPPNFSDDKKLIRRRMMISYNRQFKLIADADFGGDTSMQQVARILERWFYERFNYNSVSNKKQIKPYDALKLNEYLDKMIVACGYYYHTNQLFNLEKEVLEWTSNLYDTTDAFYISFEIYDLYQSAELYPEDYIYPETIWIEKQIKSILCSVDALSSYVDTVQKFAINNGLTDVVEKGLSLGSLGGN